MPITSINRENFAGCKCIFMVFKNLSSEEKVIQLVPVEDALQSLAFYFLLKEKNVKRADLVAMGRSTRSDVIPNPMDLTHPIVSNKLGRISAEFVQKVFNWAGFHRNEKPECCRKYRHLTKDDVKFFRSFDKEELVRVCNFLNFLDMPHLWERAWTFVYRWYQADSEVERKEIIGCYKVNRSYSKKIEEPTAKKAKIYDEN